MAFHTRSSRTLLFYFKSFGHDAFLGLGNAICLILSEVLVSHFLKSVQSTLGKLETVYREIQQRHLSSGRLSAGCIIFHTNERRNEVDAQVWCFPLSFLNR